MITEIKLNLLRLRTLIHKIKNQCIVNYVFILISSLFVDYIKIFNEYLT